MGVYSINKSIITENYVLSGDDIIMNFNKWKPNTANNILYVTGLSGSGKTTLAEEYEKKYKAEMFEIDGLEHDYDSSKSKLLEKAKTRFPEFAKLTKTDISNLSIDERIDLLRKVLLYIISEMRNNKTTLYILEGIQIFEWLDPNTLKSKPLIIKGTSMTKSIYQRWKRNGGGKIDWIAELQNRAPQLFKWYMDSEKRLKKFKKAVNENGALIIEAASSERKYKCPFCEYRDTRENLVSHVDEIHEELLSDEFPAARAVFNSINKKERGSCIICGKETKWNNDVWRYERLCDRPTCQKRYVQLMKSRMINKYGQEHLLNDPEKQKEMLANRKISGTYKFADGGVRTYCGSYEKKLLEFYDKVLHVHSKDVLTPGPVIEYSFNGKIHHWITDVYYLPANLVHDVKDGGDNPNNREMGDYRAKQIAKEDAISKINKYNYIRLTNNNFEQLLLILAEIKHKMIDYDKQPENEFVIHINESTIINESKKMFNHKLYHLSTKNLDNTTLTPRLPDNFLTKNGYEENTTKRVCFTTSIDKSLMAMSMNLKGVELYVHEPVSYNLTTKKPSVKEIPDSKIIGEVWVLEPVKIKCIGKIKVIEDTGDPGIPYKYGDKTAELYKWNWEWIEKYNSVKESAATAAALPNQYNQADNAYIIPYMMNNSFNIGLSTDKYFSNFYKIEDGKIKKGSIKDLYNTTYDIYKYNRDDFKKIYESILNDYANEIEVDSKYYFYEKLTGKRLLTPDQLEFDENLEESVDAYIESVINAHINEATLIHLINEQTNSNLYMELTNINDIDLKNKLQLNPNTSILQDIDGYFLYNQNTNRRTKSYDSISTIPHIITMIDKLAE